MKPSTRKPQAVALKTSSLVFCALLTLIPRVSDLFVAVPSASLAPDAEIHYAPIPSWVAPVPPPAPASSQQDGLVHFTYSDLQILADGAGTETYQAYRAKLLRPEALALGSMSIAWMPDAGNATVHHLRIIRGEEVIDVLKDTKFAIFQPPTGIEYSILSGQRLANLQVPGLRVGDEIEFAFTIRTRERALPDNAYGLAQLAALPASGSLRFRLTWADGKEPAWKVTPDLSSRVQKSARALEINLENPLPLRFPDGAPARYAFQRFVEFSDFKNWQRLSAVMAPSFSQAARLPADSPVRQVAARITSENPDPISRARAALQLVQDEVRYVYVGMNGANLIPAPADETWQRRYGDCKAKTVLLMALLSDMGIAARPILVNSNGGDGLNERLPNPEVFDHVLVQAQIAGEWYWLDGTRRGDLRLRTSPPDFYKWALPLTPEGSDITAVPFVPLNAPESLDVMDVDARGGYDKPARLTLVKILRGDQALASRTALASLSAAQAETQLKQMLDSSFTDVESVGWRFDPDTAALVITIVSQHRIDWESVSGGTRWASSILGAGFFPPGDRTRSADQDASVPWHNDPHEFYCFVTTMHLPKAEPGWDWSYSAKAMDDVIGGVAYWRMAELTDDTMKTVMGKRTMRDELSAEDAQAANRQISGFNNLMSRVFQVKGGAARSPLQVADASIQTVPAASGHDWVKDAAPCIAPRLR